jgi:hypothetical protein
MLIFFGIFLSFTNLALGNRGNQVIILQILREKHQPKKNVMAY